MKSLLLVFVVLAIGGIWWHYQTVSALEITVTQQENSNGVLKRKIAEQDKIIVDLNKKIEEKTQLFSLKTMVEGNPALASLEAQFEQIRPLWLEYVELHRAVKSQSFSSTEYEAEIGKYQKAYNDSSAALKSYQDTVNFCTTRLAKLRNSSSKSSSVASSGTTSKRIDELQDRLDVAKQKYAEELIRLRDNKAKLDCAQERFRSAQIKFNSEASTKMAMLDVKYSKVISTYKKIREEIKKQKLKLALGDVANHPAQEENTNGTN